jgi:serine protease Do
MKITGSRLLTFALLLGASAIFPANSVRAEDPAAPAPKPADGQPVGVGRDLATFVSAEDYLVKDPRLNAPVPSENVNVANYYNALTNTAATSLADRLIVAHAGKAACTACHSDAGAVAENGPYAQVLKGVRLIDTLPTEFELEMPADTVLGARLQPIEDPVRSQLGLEEKTGLLVASLVDEGAAAKAGLRQNDILLTLADAPLADAADLPTKLKGVGEKDVPLKLVRAGRRLTIQIRPVTLWTIKAAEPQKVDYYIGVSATPPDDVLRAHVELPDGQGLLVNEVDAGSPAEKSGVKKYDILLKLDDTAIDKTETLSAKVQTVGGKPAKLAVLRASKTITITVTPEPRKVETANQDHEKTVRLWRTVVNARRNSLLNVVTHDSPFSTVQTYRIPPSGYVSTVPPQAPADPAAMARQLDELEKELKALRKTIEEVRDSVKQEK